MLNSEESRCDMGIDITRFKVVYNDRVLRAIALMDVFLPEQEENSIPQFVWESPDELELLVIDENGRVKRVRDKAEKFQFLPT
jgi:hypothetical protein